jgi:hypothetical protein
MGPDPISLPCLSVAASPIRVSLLDALSVSCSPPFQARSPPGPTPAAPSTSPTSASASSSPARSSRDGNPPFLSPRSCQLITLSPSKGKRVSFFPLKDSHGTTQLIASPQAFSDLANVPLESSVLIQGTVLPRPQGARREVFSSFFSAIRLLFSPPLFQGATGEIDVQVESFTVLNPASTLPFTPSNPFNLVR